MKNKMCIIEFGVLVSCRIRLCKKGIVPKHVTLLIWIILRKCIANVLLITISPSNSLFYFIFFFFFQFSKMGKRTLCNSKYQIGSFVTYITYFLDIWELHKVQNKYQAKNVFRNIIQFWGASFPKLLFCVSW